MVRLLSLQFVGIELITPVAVVAREPVKIDAGELPEGCDEDADYDVAYPDIY